VNWDNGGSGSAFFNLDRVTFSDAAEIKTIDLATTVHPGKITFTNTGINDYVINGVGGISGMGEGLVKNGDGWLDLGGINTFVGPVQVNDGKLKLLSPQALGFTSGVTITNSSPAAGQLDINGQLLTDSSRSFSATISGDGWDSNGAIINSSATSTISGGSAKSGIRNLTLAANASVGGSGSFDLVTGGSINGGGFTLTKKGAGTVLLNGPVTNLSTVIEGGTLSTNLDGGFGSTLLVKTGATASCPNTSGTYNHSTNVTVENSGILKSNTSINWNGTFVAEGNLQSLTQDNSGVLNCVVNIDVSIPSGLDA
jgi:autotransporter-associated beta strand protein